MTMGHQPVDFDNDFVQIVGGKCAPTQSSRHGLNPSNKQPLPPVPVATQQDLDDAVAAGKAAFKTWSRLPDQHRKKAVLNFAAAIEAHSTDLAHLLTREHGKTIVEAHHEVELLPLFLRGHAQIEWREEVVEDSERRTVVTRYVPLGVVAAIVPWSFPLLMATGKLAPALLTGNVIILKPSPFAPYSCLKLVELAQQFFPPGVVQSLSGDDDLGPWMTSHPGFNKISFTGSVAAGKEVMRSASKNLTRVTLELGGNDAAIVLPDVQVKSVAAKVAANAFMNLGQVCITIKRVYVHEDIYEEFRDAMVQSLAQYSIGDASSETSTHGPLQNAPQHERVKALLDDVERESYKVLVGGQVKPSSPGYYMKPMIVDEPADDSRIVVEEQFGPIIPLLSWRDEENVITRANNSSMGLGASVWGSNVHKASELARELQAGSVWVNQHTGF
ncbi:aldehyde dehydrogenase [Colletotrichum graminicola M1.001]|uniref:aldehyde dehydrogenase (NAD(+)) n=1 Tax=Colletotrichum graminicola (strain M1.001 / M2 / FGSC 10212) TaxID=645133 RepID=E3QTD3_COLGM|nr:aldehyde dehydrogenase [Colletotrichum graminicola M1.001]EFQ34121.1 aldehyde dehydrogenase [Colletotrichum graminicola M1.001]